MSDFSIDTPNGLTRFESLVAMADEIERLEALVEWHKESAQLWRRAAKCWLNVAHRFGTVTPDQARDAINEAEAFENA